MACLSLHLLREEEVPRLGGLGEEEVLDLLVLAVLQPVRLSLWVGGLVATSVMGKEEVLALISARRDDDAALRRAFKPPRHAMHATSQYRHQRERLMVCGMVAALRTTGLGGPKASPPPTPIIIIPCFADPSPLSLSLLVFTLSQRADSKPHAHAQRMVSGGRCLAFALRLPHGGNVVTRSHGVVLGGARPPLGGRRMLSTTEASPAPAAPAPSKGM